MLPSRILTVSLRGANALASNQFGPLLFRYNNNDAFTIEPINRRLHTNPVSWAYLDSMDTLGKKQKMIDIHVDLPEKPKKPITPWLAFVRERKDDVLRQKDKMTAAELAVILSKEWKHIDKSSYQEDYERRHKDYERKVENYSNSLTKEQSDYLKLQSTIKRELKAKKQLQKTKPPVLPRNSANFYCHERSKHEDVKEQMKVRKAADVFSDIFKEYRELPESEKQKYIAMQEDDKSRFQHEFIAWYESVQNNENLTKLALEKANRLRERFEALQYI